MLVKLSTSALKQTRWYEYGVRFCASATLIESHERRGKEKVGLSGRRRGQQAAALDAAGAGLGGIGLAAFAAVFHILVSASIVGAFATAILA